MLNLELWHEQLQCIVKNIVGINDTMCRCAYIQKRPIEWLLIKMLAVFDKHFCFSF